MRWDGMDLLSIVVLRFIRNVCIGNEWMFEVK